MSSHQCNWNHEKLSVLRLFFNHFSEAWIFKYKIAPVIFKGTLSRKSQLCKFVSISGSLSLTTPILIVIELRSCCSWDINWIFFLVCSFADVFILKVGLARDEFYIVWEAFSHRELCHVRWVGGGWSPLQKDFWAFLFEVVSFTYF